MTGFSLLPTELVQHIFSHIAPSSCLKYRRLSHRFASTLLHRDFARLNLLRFIRNDLLVSALRTNPDAALARLWFHWPQFYAAFYAQKYLASLNVVLWNAKQLRGEIPQSIRFLTKATTINLDMNQLRGTIPDELEPLRECLASLSLCSNYLTGAIPRSICTLVNLKNLYLDGNELAGSIPDEIGLLQQLVWLYLGNNYLSGAIPPSIGHCRALVILNLSNNRLTGPLPVELGHLPRLERLDLKNNLLSGPVPSSFELLTRLHEFCAAGNDLVVSPELGGSSVARNPWLIALLRKGIAFASETDSDAVMDDEEAENLIWD
ncbi:hypothetical protein HDU98_010268 [Podochytrium sp. JEL0797]|nr:hypothetical protein HDU98_010250 [Podochytrium sp. JEL0797]KAJ3076992.1 hypothetical protein HDU98_010268 [Podochytrium sp. JEL0797]